MLALEWNLDDAKQAWFEEGMEKGLEKGREAVAIKLIRMGFQFADIQKATDLPIQYIQQLAQNNSVD